MYIIGNSAQCYVAAWMGGKSGGEWILVLAWLSPFAVHLKLYSQSYGFSSSHVQMWELDHKEGWVPKNWCFWIVVLENSLESPLDSKEINPVNPKGN